MNLLKPQKTKNFSKNKILDKLYNSILNSDRPLLLAGHGVRLSDSAEKLRLFIRKMKIPTVFTWNACDILDFNNDFYIGKPGNVANRAANFAIQGCSLFVSIGARLDNITTAYNIHSFARNASEKWVLDIDQNQLKVCKLEGSIKINIDINYALGYLNNKKELD